MLLNDGFIGVRALMFLTEVLRPSRYRLLAFPIVTLRDFINAV